MAQTILLLPASPSLSKEQLHRVVRHLAWHLYMGSGLLVIAVIVLKALYSWPAALAETPDPVMGIANAIATLFGGIYTLLLIVLFGPAALAVRHRAIAVGREELERERLETEVTDQQVSEWLDVNGLQPTGTQQVVRVLAALGPLLAGPLVELLRVVAG